MTVHVITASKHESTREIGEAIAQRLRDRGHAAVSEDAATLRELEAGEPVVLGSPIYMGKWRKEARGVADRLAAESPGRPIWLFTVGPLGDPPEPEDAGPEEEVERFAAERAIGHRVFTGRLDPSRLNRRERLAVRAVKAPEGDFRDWAAIEAWTDQISATLAAQLAGGPGRKLMPRAETASLVDEFLSEYDVSDTVACSVSAGPEACWGALMDVDLIEVGKRKPLIGLLGAVRMLPELASHLLHGERPPRAPETIRLRDMGELPRAEGGWIPLAERPGEEIALGLIGKFWRPVIEYVSVEAADFGDFGEPGWAKTVYCLGVTPLADDRTLLWGTMRTATTDETARRWFRRYWTFGVGAGAHLLVNGLLEVAREAAESRALSSGAAGNGGAATATR